MISSPSSAVDLQNPPPDLINRDVLTVSCERPGTQSAPCKGSLSLTKMNSFFEYSKYKVNTYSKYKVNIEETVWGLGVSQDICFVLVGYFSQRYTCWTGSCKAWFNGGRWPGISGIRSIRWLRNEKKQLCFVPNLINIWNEWRTVSRHSYSSNGPSRQQVKVGGILSQVQRTLENVLCPQWNASCSCTVVVPIVLLGSHLFRAQEAFSSFDVVDDVNNVSILMLRMSSMSPWGLRRSCSISKTDHTSPWRRRCR